MLDFSFAELALIVVVAVVFIGPKELPVVVRAVAKALRSIRGLAGEVHQAFDELGRESGLKDAADDISGQMKSIKGQARIMGDDGKWYDVHDTSHLTPRKKPEEAPHE